jgi:hypothetical protein
MSSMNSPCDTSLLSGWNADIPRSNPADRALFVELLALHEGMIEQLRIEQIGTRGHGEFLASQISHHEQAIAALRAQLAHLPGDQSQPS